MSHDIQKSRIWGQSTDLGIRLSLAFRQLDVSFRSFIEQLHGPQSSPRWKGLDSFTTCRVVRVNRVCAWLLALDSFILIPVSLNLQYRYLEKSYSLFLWTNAIPGKIEYVGLWQWYMYIRNQRKQMHVYFTSAPVIFWGTTDSRKWPEGLMATG